MARPPCRACWPMFNEPGDPPTPRATGRDGLCTPCRTIRRTVLAKMRACVNLTCNCGPVGGGTNGWRPRLAWGKQVWEYGGTPPPKQNRPAARWRAKIKNSKWR